MSKHVAFAPFTLLLLIGPAHADVTFINSCPYFISQPGQYHLGQDLTCSISGTGITVNANDVALYFDGHTLATPDNVSVGVLSNAGVSNLSIHGSGTITGFGEGILLNRNNGALIVNITVTVATSAIGIDIFSGSSNTLISNKANGNGSGIGSGVGIRVEGPNNTVRANETQGNQVGIDGIAGVTGNLVQANHHFETPSGPGASCIQERSNALPFRRTEGNREAGHSLLKITESNSNRRPNPRLASGWKRNAWSFFFIVIGS